MLKLAEERVVYRYLILLGIGMLNFLIYIIAIPKMGYYEKYFLIGCTIGMIGGYFLSHRRWKKVDTLIKSSHKITVTNRRDIRKFHEPKWLFPVYAFLSLIVTAYNGTMPIIIASISVLSGIVSGTWVSLCVAMIFFLFKKENILKTKIIINTKAD